MPRSPDDAGRSSGRDSHDPFPAMYQNQVGVNFGKGLADPFVPVLAIRLGATAGQLGWLQAFVNLFPAVMQVPWGKLSDFFGRRIPFLVVGGVLSFGLYFFMVGSVSPWQLIFLVSVQMAVGSMMIPTWSALVGDNTTPKNRGSVMSKFFAVSTVASLVGTLLAGAIMPEDEDGQVLAVFALPFFMAGLSGIIGSLALMSVRERRRLLHASPKRIFAFGLKSFLFTSDLTSNVYFRNLIILNTAFNFIMSLIWPILYLTYVKVIGASLLEIAIMTVISGGATVFFQTRVGRLMDLTGPMPLIMISRFAYISVPIVYALATHAWHIYLLNAALGLANAMSNVAFFSYILDVAPEEKKAEYFAVYNTMIGIATFFGSILGGYLTNYFLERYAGNYVLSLGAVYAISAVGRTVCAILFFKLKDPVQYPTTLRRLIRKRLSEWSASMKG